MATEHRPSKIEIVAMVNEVLATHCADPGTALIAQGKALMKLGQALKDCSYPEARAVMRAVSELL